MFSANGIPRLRFLEISKGNYNPSPGFQEVRLSFTILRVPAPASVNYKTST